MEKPEIIGYSVLDSKGRITVPHKLRKDKKGFLLAQYDKILLLIDPDIIIINNGGL